MTDAGPVQNQPYDEAVDLRGPQVTQEEWDEGSLPRTVESVLAALRGYLPFAWEKCSNHRGLSAVRSVQTVRALCWLLGHTDLLDFIDEPLNYYQYGAPILNRVCEVLGMQELIPDSLEIANMVRHMPCTPNCPDGCEAAPNHPSFQGGGIDL